MRVWIDQDCCTGECIYLQAERPNSTQADDLDIVDAEIVPDPN